MADGSERRVARRFTMSLPLRVLPREARSSELRTQTRDVSYQGLYFLAEAQVEANANGHVGVAAKIERYEFLPATASAA